MGVGAGEVGPGIQSPGAGAAAATPGHGITSGALPGSLSNTQLNAGVQVDVTSDRFVVLTGAPSGTPWAMSVRLSPDGVTYTALTMIDGVIGDQPGIGIYVPKNWYIQSSGANLTGVTGVFY